VLLGELFHGVVENIKIFVMSFHWANLSYRLF